MVEVDLYPASLWVGRGEHIAIYVVDEATEAEALQLWCDVVLPAGAAQLGRQVALVKNPGNPIGVFPDQFQPPPCP